MSNESIIIAILVLFAYKLGVFMGKYGHLSITQLNELKKNQNNGY
jgi:hypothetical protein